MHYLAITRACADVARATRDTQTVLRSTNQLAEIVDAFWELQNRLGILLHWAVDKPIDTFDELRIEQPRLIQEIVQVLELTRTSHLSQTAAIDSACSAINNLLAELEHRTRRAGALSVRSH